MYPKHCNPIKISVYLCFIYIPNKTSAQAQLANSSVFRHIKNRIAENAMDVTPDNLVIFFFAVLAYLSTFQQRFIFFPKSYLLSLLSSSSNNPSSLDEGTKSGLMGESCF